MKININSKCIGCGLCFSEDKYIFEGNKGFAKSIDGIVVSPNDEKRILKISELCPCKAIVVEEINLNKNNKMTIDQMIVELENALSRVAIPRLNHSNAPFIINKYSFDFPGSELEITEDFNTKSSAQSAAKNEFNNLVYCSSARNAQITRILMEYKVKYGRPYYTLDNSTDSFYYSTNKSIEKILNSFAEVVNDLGSYNIPKDWITVKSMPDKNDILFKHLLDYPKYDSPNDKIWLYIMELGPTSLSDYVNYMDFDCFDWGDGSLLGSLFAKKDWNFSGFDKAVDEFVNDLIRAFNYYTDSIEESFYFAVNSVLEEYEELLKTEISVKIKDIKKILY